MSDEIVYLADGGGPTDQDVDTAGTEADDGHADRIREHDVTLHDPTAEPVGALPDDGTRERRGDAPGNDGPPLSPLNPSAMHRAEDDTDARATSPDFSERPDRASKEPRPR